MGKICTLCSMREPRFADLTRHRRLRSRRRNTVLKSNDGTVDDVDAVAGGGGVARRLGHVVQVEDLIELDVGGGGAGRGQ